MNNVPILNLASLYLSNPHTVSPTYILGVGFINNLMRLKQL